MKMSNMFGLTLRDAPADAELVSQQLLIRAGFIRQLGTGLYSYLPFARRSMNKIENIMRDEIDGIGGQEMTMPVVHPADVWKETGRWYKIGSELTRFLDRNARDMVLAMTHEEVVTDLVRREVQSYRHLPRLVYHIQTKWRDEARPRAGLIRVREFTMKDSYSLDADWEGLDKQYRNHYQAYFNIFNRCALPSVAVQADVGMMGGTMAHEYMYLTPIGEDTLVLCDNCDYIANRQIATFQKPTSDAEEALGIEKVVTPDTKTIQELADFLNISKSKTAKAIFLMATLIEEGGDVERFVFAIVRGDMDLNETKLSNAISAKELRPATEQEIRAIGAEPGYASPVGLDAGDYLIVVDDLIPNAPNLVAGANEVEFHYTNVNYGRDFEAQVVVDIVNANGGDPCPQCASALRTSRGVEIGNIFKLGDFYTSKLKATYVDADSEQKPVIMGSYGIGVGRLLASVAEEHNDENGLIWPISIAPYEVHIVSLKDADYAASVLYEQLEKAGVEVLYDDRDESAGVKFNDADLIGLPLRITVGKRGLQRGEVEIKRRDEADRRSIAIDEVVEVVEAEIAKLQAELQASVRNVEYIP